MRYSVGLSQADRDFTDCIIENREHIYEVYFSWGDFPNGRSSLDVSGEYAAWELLDMQREALKRLSAHGIRLALLLNANCYGKDSQSRAFFNRVGMTVDYIRTRFGLDCVTTTSPLIARFLKDNFEGLKVRASVNMEIGTVEGMEYLSNYFDSYYMKRELNRDLEAVRRLRRWCDWNGKKLFGLANSGCLNHCSARIFHDNLVAHEAEIAQMDNAYAFCGICREYLSEEKHYAALIERTNFIRPEDIGKYEPYFEAVKLATRVHRSPSLVLNSYVRGSYSGNILELLEPVHSIYPYVVENGEPLKLVKLNTDI